MLADFKINYCVCACLCACVCSVGNILEGALLKKKKFHIKSKTQWRPGQAAKYIIGPRGRTTRSPEVLTSLSKLRAGCVAGAIHLCSLRHPAEQCPLHHHRGAFISALRLPLLFLY